MNKRLSKPSSATLLALLAGIHLSALPLYANMPVVILLLISLLTLWQVFIIKRQQENPGRTLQITIIVAAFLSLLFSYGQLFGQQPGIALVILMTLLKLFETRGARDGYTIIYSSFFITASNFFHSQSVWLVVYVFFVIAFLLASLIALSDRLNTVSTKTRYRMASRFTILALPFMLILFVLFPRIPGPLWGLPDDAFAGQSGLSETMSPGSINRLISSSAIAFRVKFHGDIPEHNQRYWRGAVLSIYDGKTWSRRDVPLTEPPNIQYQDTKARSFRYSVTLQPTNMNWLLALEYPESYGAQYTLNHEAMLLTENKQSNVISYTVTSQTTAVNRALLEQEQYKNRLLPLNHNPQTMALSDQLLRLSKYNREDYIREVLSYFRNNHFVYTLNPDLLGDNAVDDFLFNSRRGFCEHYASAFTYLMRAAGLPARVVIGYQGGEMNPLDDYMIVRQSDAHAWAEVWINDRWQRFDPTAVVSPDRIEQGIQDAGLEQDRLPLLLVSNSHFIKSMSFLYDSFQNSWNQWVIGFDQKKQNDFLKFLGFENTGTANLILLLVILLTLTGVAISWLILRQTIVERDPVQHYYNIFCSRIGRLGLPRHLNEGPVDYEKRINRELNLAQQTRNDLGFIFKAYRALHYRNQSNSDLLKLYIKKIKAFK